MKKISILTVIILLVLSTSLAAAGASILTVQGRVSVQQRPGAGWTQAYAGMQLGQGATVSTGYGAAALLRITPGTTVFRVNQFTTMSISTLTSGKGGVNTGLTLRMGTIRAVVKSTPTLRSRFQISTPVATASVRGTIPEVSHFPGVGTSIAYLQGSGFVRSLRGRMQLLGVGQRSRTGGDGQSTTPFQEAYLKSAAGSVLQQLTPGARSLLAEGIRGALAAFGPQGVGRTLQQFRKRITILSGAYDPTPL